MVLQKAIYALNCPIYGALSLIGRISSSRNQGMEMGAAPFTFTLNDTLSKKFISVPMTCSAGLEVFVPER